MKKLNICILAVLIMLTGIIPANAAEKKDTSISGNLIKINTADGFNAGTLENLEIDSSVGDGALVLKANETEGLFTSAVYDVKEFQLLVATWNASFSGLSSVEVQARAYVTGSGRNDWTGWLSWGKYSQYIHRGGNFDTDPVHNWASMEEDTFTVSGSYGAVKMQLRAYIRRDNAQISSPVLRQITATIDNRQTGKEITPVYEEEEVTVPQNKYNAAPAYSQLIRDPDIGGSICSPTTISVMLNSRNPSLNLLPEELALNIKDFENDDFGNWSYTVSGAGLYGYEAYCQYADTDIILKELAKGNTVGLSVKYYTSPSNPYYLKGAYGDTGGHLIAIVGYEFEEGHDGDKDYLWFYSSDSYSANDTTSYHRYNCRQLETCWPRRLAYIIPSQSPVNGADTAGIERVSCKLESKSANTYEMTANGKKIDLNGFTSGKDTVSGHGILAYTVDGFSTDMTTQAKATSCSVVYPNPINVTANNTFYYTGISTDANGNLVINADEILKSLGVPEGEKRTVTVYAIANNGYRYSATIYGLEGEAGDVNADGDINVADALCALEASVGKTELSYSASLAADVDGDSSVTSSDALLILQYSVRLIEKFN